MKLTKEQVEKYIEDGATHCPFCGSSKTECTDSYLPGRLTRTYTGMRCCVCNEEWSDGYSLNSVVTGFGEDSELIYTEKKISHPPLNRG